MDKITDKKGISKKKEINEVKSILKGSNNIYSKNGAKLDKKILKR